MPARIRLKDELDLPLIAGSGQCFRMKEGDYLGEGSWRMVFKDRVLYLRKIEERELLVQVSPEEFSAVWEEYLDLGTHYQSLRRWGSRGNEVLKKAFQEGEGLRLLRQDPWEMLITFILSQRKSIPAIKTNVEDLCKAYGERIETPFEVLYAFPEPEALYQRPEEELRALGLGYRAPYVADAARAVAEGELCLGKLYLLPDEELIQSLMGVKGVGIKVASCVALFGYGRKDVVPVDVWISRSVQEDCQGEDPFPAFSPYRGLAQQYLFTYLQRHKGERTRKRNR